MLNRHPKKIIINQSIGSIVLTLSLARVQVELITKTIKSSHYFSSVINSLISEAPAIHSSFSFLQMHAKRHPKNLLLQSQKGRRNRVLYASLFQSIGDRSGLVEDIKGRPKEENQRVNSFRSDFPRRSLACVLDQCMCRCLCVCSLMSFDRESASSFFSLYFVEC